MRRAGFILSALVLAWWVYKVWNEDDLTREAVYYAVYFAFLSLVGVWVVVLLAAVIRFVVRANRTNRTDFVKPS